MIKIKLVFFWGMAVCLALGLVFLGQATAQNSQDPLAEEPALFEAFLYFPNGTHLRAVPKQFSPGLGAHRLGREILQALMAGPPNPGLDMVFPENTRVNTLFILGNGDAYVDLGMDPGGFSSNDTLTEYLGVYSLVNSLAVNIPEIKQVKILVNGEEGASFGSHLSLDTFFITNMLIVK